MKVDSKILYAVLELLAEKKPVNKHSICKKASIHRFSLDYRINKHNDFIYVEVVENV